jgi:hypothetical protein
LAAWITCVAEGHGDPRRSLSSLDLSRSFLFRLALEVGLDRLEETKNAKPDRLILRAGLCPADAG